jgi:hypothetical protein
MINQLGYHLWILFKRLIIYKIIYRILIILYYHKRVVIHYSNQQDHKEILICNYKVSLKNHYKVIIHYRIQIIRIQMIIVTLLVRYLNKIV